MSKFKVGDTVRVKSLEWYNENKKKSGGVLVGSSLFFDFMKSECGKQFVISGIYDHINDYTAYYLTGTKYVFCDGMLEDEAVTISEPPVKDESAASVFMDKIRSYIRQELAGQISTIKFDLTSKEVDSYEAAYADDFVDWEKHRFDLIKAVLPALVQGDNSAEYCAKKSIEMADEVIKLLKEERLTKDTKNVSDGI